MCDGALITRVVDAAVADLRRELYAETERINTMLLNVSPENLTNIGERLASLEATAEGWARVAADAAARAEEAADDAEDSAANAEESEENAEESAEETPEEEAEEEAEETPPPPPPADVAPRRAGPWYTRPIFGGRD